MHKLIELAFESRFSFVSHETNGWPIAGRREEYRFASNKDELFVSLPTNPLDVDGCLFLWKSTIYGPVFKYYSCNPLQPHYHFDADCDVHEDALFLAKAFHRLGYDIDALCQEHGLNVSNHEKEQWSYEFRQLQKDPQFDSRDYYQKAPKVDAPLPEQPPSPAFKILRGFRYKGKFFAKNAEREAALLASKPTSEELADWTKRGLIGSPDEVATPAKTSKRPRDLIELGEQSERLNEKLKASYLDAEIGDFTTYESLCAGAGKFYKLDGQEFCDLPTTTFRADEKSPYWERIE